MKLGAISKLDKRNTSTSKLFDNVREAPSDFFPTSGDWGKLGILNLARMCLNAA